MVRAEGSYSLLIIYKAILSRGNLQAIQVLKPMQMRLFSWEQVLSAPQLQLLQPLVFPT